MHLHLPAAAATVTPTLATSPDPGWPAIARPDVGAVLLSTWTVDTPDRQQATIDAFTDAWRGAAWPDGLLTTTLFASTDGTRVVNDATWTSADAHQDALARSGRNAVGQGRRWQDVQQFPGLASSSVTRYHLAQSLARPMEGA